MSQLVKGFFGKEGRREKVEKAVEAQQNSDESDGMFREMEDRTFEPMETSSEKKSNQVSIRRCLRPAIALRTDTTS